MDLLGPRVFSLVRNGCFIASANVMRCKQKKYFNTASKYLLHILSTVELLLNEQIYLGRLVAEHLAYQVEHFVPVLVSSHLATYLYVRTQLLD